MPAEWVAKDGKDNNMKDEDKNYFHRVGAWYSGGLNVSINIFIKNYSSINFSQKYL